MIDSFIGTRFGLGGHLEVIGVCERVKDKPIKYKSICHVCGQKEKYKDIVYISRKSHLVSGRIPCQCERKWLSEDAQSLKITAECETRGLEFLGFVGEYIGGLTKLKLRCSQDGHEWEKCCVDNFFRGRGCPECQRRKATKSEEEAVKGFVNTGSFVEGTRFWKLTQEASKSKWAYSCPVCSVDWLVQQGLCSGVFVSTQTRLTTGYCSCRCSPTELTVEQRAYQVHKRIKEEDLPYKFLGWKSAWKGIQTKLHLVCEKHGDFFPSIKSFVNAGTGCTSCSKTGFDPNKDAFIYVLRAEGASGDFTGYGITCDATARIKKHISSLSREGFSMAEYRLFPVAGTDALLIEKAIKDNFTRFPQIVEGFKTEATFPHLYPAVVEFIQSSLPSPTHQ